MNSFFIDYIKDGKAKTIQFYDSIKACERAKILAISLKETISVFKVDLNTGKSFEVYQAYPNGSGMVKNVCLD